MFDLGSIKKAMGNYFSQLKKVQEEIENLRQEREDVLFAPPTRDDAMAAMAAWIKSRAKTYRDSVKKGLGELALNRGALEDPARFAEMAQRLPLVHQKVYGPADGPVDLMVSALMGDALMRSFASVVDEMPWPAGALSTAQRNEKLAAIDMKLEKLIELEKQLGAAAADAGINVEMVG